MVWVIIRRRGVSSDRRRSSYFIGSDNGLSPDRRQAIIWTNAGLLLIGPLGTNFSEILIEILTFSFKKMHLKVLFVKRRPFCLCLNILIIDSIDGDDCLTLVYVDCCLKLMIDIHFMLLSFQLYCIEKR